MKTIEEIMDRTRPVKDIIDDLKKKYVKVPVWSEYDGKAGLVCEYDPKKHPIYTDPEYQDVKEDGKKYCRVACGWQKLATKRMAELTFGLPVKRIWNAETDEQMRAVNFIEGVLTKNRIDSVNLDRAKKLYAGCEFATIWYNQKTETVYGGEKSHHKIRCKTYSPMTGDAIYPLFDEYDDLIALSVQYARTEGKHTDNYFEVYTENEHMRWRKDGEQWVEDMVPEEAKIGKIAGVYAHRSEPIWEEESENVYEVEWELSRNGNYLKKNSAPLFKVFGDPEELAMFKHENPDETGKQSRKILYFPKDAKAEYETWNQSTEALKFQSETIRRNFFTQLQLPDMSFESMKTTPMSGEARKMMFIDSELKVLDESGVWIDTFFRECSVVKEFAKLAMPSEFGAVIDSLELKEVIITPYRIEDDNEKVTNLTAATGGKPIMSQATAIAKYGAVDDVEEEIKKINEESASALEEMAF